MQNKMCPKCKVALKPGIANMNPIGKVVGGMFKPIEQCGSNETVYPVQSKLIMVPVDKCPSCGYSVAVL